MAGSGWMWLDLAGSGRWLKKRRTYERRRRREASASVADEKNLGYGSRQQADGIRQQADGSLAMAASIADEGRRSHERSEEGRMARWLGTSDHRRRRKTIGGEAEPRMARWLWQQASPTKEDGVTEDRRRGGWLAGWVPAIVADEGRRSEEGRSRGSRWLWQQASPTKEDGVTEDRRRGGWLAGWVLAIVAAKEDNQRRGGAADLAGYGSKRRRRRKTESRKIGGGADGSLAGYQRSSPTKEDHRRRGGAAGRDWEEIRNAECG